MSHQAQKSPINERPGWARVEKAAASKVEEAQQYALNSNAIVFDVADIVTAPR